jgi:hypothetical protein
MDKENLITSNEELNDIICEECNKVCDAKRFQHNFKNWANGNNDIKKFIQHTQLSGYLYMSKPLVWIPYDRFNGIEYIAKGRFD